MEVHPIKNIKPFGLIVRDEDFFKKSEDIINSFRKVESDSQQENNVLLEQTKAEEE